MKRLAGGLGQQEQEVRADKTLPRQETVLGLQRQDVLWGP